MTNEPDLDAFDRDLRALLEVEPTDGFMEGVRARIAETRPSRPAVWWLVPALAAGLAAAVVARLAMRTPPAPAETPRTIAIAPPRPAPPIGPGVAPPSVTRAVAPRPRPVPPARPEVIVPPGGERALLAFVAAANARGRKAAPLTASANAGEDLDPPAPIDIAPLETAPLAEPTRSDS